MRTQDIIWKTCWEQWMIGTECEIGKYLLSVQLDNDDDKYIYIYKNVYAYV